MPGIDRGSVEKQPVACRPELSWRPRSAWQNLRSRSWGAKMRPMILVPALLGAALLASSALAAEKKVTLEGKFGQVMSSQKVKPEIPGAPELAQNVRLDQLTSSDPDWNGATITLYEHSESFPSYGLYKVY